MENKSIEELTLTVYNHVVVGQSNDKKSTNMIDCIQKGVKEYLRDKVVKVYTPTDIVNWAEYVGYDLAYTNAARMLNALVEDNSLSLVESDEDAFVKYVQQYGGIYCNGNAIAK